MILFPHKFGQIYFMKKQTILSAALAFAALGLISEDLKAIVPLLRLHKTT